MTSFQLATINLAHMKYAYDAPEMADFIAQLDPIYALAENSPGFVWRPDDIEGIENTKHLFGDTTLVNMSVWQDFFSLHHFTYKTAHLGVMRKRQNWFKHSENASMVLWWVEAGSKPSLAEAKSKLETLDQLGPTPAAFTFKQAFPPPQAAEHSNAFKQALHPLAEA